MGRAIAGWVGSFGLDQFAVYVVAHQKIPRPIQHSSSPIWEFVYPHPDLQNHRTVRALRNLEALAVIVDGVALRYDPLALHTQNIGKVRAGMDESGARFGRPHYKPVVIP